MIEHPFWWDTLDAAETVAGSQELDAGSVDVAVIGAGYTGLSAARALASRGATVAVLERGALGAGASSRNGGQVLTGLKLEPAALVARYGAAHARVLFEMSLDSIRQVETLIAEERIDCDFSRGGHIQAAWKPAHFEAFQDEQRLLAAQFDYRVEVIPRSEQTREIGTLAYHGLLIDENSAGLNPAKYVHGLARAALRRGARIFTATPVTSLERQHDAWNLTTPRGALQAREVLIATDAYSTALTPALQRRLLPVGSYAIATAPLRAATAAQLLPRRRMAFDSKHFLYYFRLTADNRLLFGGRAEFSTPSPASTHRAAHILRAGMIGLFPPLSDTRIDYVWGGLVGMTRDQLPHAGRLNGMFYACGYSGHGIALATMLGDAIGRKMAGEAVTHPLIDDGLRPIPLHFGTPWFLPLIGGYYRFKDAIG